MTVWRTVTWYGLVELGKNRLAVVLVLGFVPLWITLAHVVASPTPLQFRYRATGGLLDVDSSQLMVIMGSLNAVTLITGFLMFSMTRRATDLDRRLVGAGCPRAVLLTAKLTALVVSTLVIACWSTSVILVYWQPEQPGLLCLGLIMAGLTYGGIGIVLGVFLPGELEGMFTVIMISLLDLILQNPLVNSTSDKDIVTFLPSYGPLQTCVGAGFTDTVPTTQMLLCPVWLTGCALIGLVAFHARTRQRFQPTRV
ncbi:hypothetical protein FHS29_007321 [Saccharothrix tamanrassetensis]|uniref:Uncharacterized protein n=1 Tax=Saccharothrix tamanrassetensis TaxID=1051531 RepID=A0A841CV40_9PSEU|nr:hypothetical protein [Saccharothrix tamanrassetensis]MBB5960693.1 hypothetical protein [Saccharothrix tamanrassetensis]